ncbi:MAG: 3'(2'),5'-bisphosphate nucleotidase CysQ [Pseudomonadota bacterium]|nr:MAG: 3'(2'),5'-bisphosphate nucleotidase CysQ [Pseudomonadota bacterium]
MADPEASNDEFAALLEPVLELAGVAGERIMAVYNTGFTVEQKADQSPVTEADMAAHDTIVEGLAALTPELPILSEEAADIPWKVRRGWQRYWLVDPLDGTREFVSRNGEFTVNIALIDGHEPVLGVVSVPVTGTSYYAARGHGAYKRRGDLEAQRIHCRIQCAEQVVIVGSRSHASKALKRYLSNVGHCSLKSMGSSIKACLVAEGKADIYPRLGPTCEWDTAAAQCVVEEAGGRVTDTSMQPLRYNTRDSLLNPHFFAYGDGDVNWAKYIG